MRTHPPVRRPVRTARFLGAVVAFAAVTPGSAPAQAPRLTVIGASAGVSRAEWVADGRADRQLEQRAFGFASAVAVGAQVRQGGDPLASMDADAIHAWLGEHCRRRPGEALSAALVRMVFAASR